MEIILFALCTVIIISDIITLHKIRKEKEVLEKIKENLKGVNENEKV